MNFEHWVTIISLITTSILGIYGLYIQSEKKKLKELKEEKTKIVEDFVVALKSIQGYQEFVKDIAIEKNKNIENLKAEIHSNKRDFFKSTRFLQPSNLQELLNRYNK
jgi:hypothetical protein